MTHHELLNYFGQGAASSCTLRLFKMHSYFVPTRLPRRLDLIEVWVCTTCDRVIEVRGPATMRDLAPDQLAIATFPFAENCRNRRRSS